MYLQVIGSGTIGMFLWLPELIQIDQIQSFYLEKIKFTVLKAPKETLWKPSTYQHNVTKVTYCAQVCKQTA